MLKEKKKQPKKNLSSLWDEGKTKVETIKLTPEVLQQFYNQNQSSSSPKPVKKQTRKIYPPSLSKTLYYKIMLDELDKKARKSDIVIQKTPWLKTNIYKINKEYVIRDNVTNEQLMPKTKNRKKVEEFMDTLQYVRNTKIKK